MRKILLSLVFLAALGFTGCTRQFPMAEVSGKVTYKGKPLPEGTIMFVPQSGFAAAGTINPDGTFRLISGKPGDGAVIGRHKVAVIPPYQPQTPNYPKFPLKYQDAETSGLVAEVKEGTNTFEFELVDKD
jgi:hypothetical protein